MNTITVLRHSEASTMPEFVFPMAMGYDIFASETILIEKGKIGFVDTSISIKVPQRCYAQIANKPSLLSIGVYAEGPVFWPGSYWYLKILLTNNGSYDLPIAIGDKIATLVLLPMDPPIMVQSLPQTDTKEASSNKQVRYL